MAKTDKCEHMFELFDEDEELYHFYCKRCLFLDSKNKEIKEGKNDGT